MNVESVNNIKAEAIEEATQCVILSHKTVSKDFEDGFDLAVDLYDEALKKYAKYLRGEE